MTAERIMQSAYEAMRTVTMILKDHPSDPEIKTCLELLEGAMGGMPQSRRREDSVLNCTTTQPNLLLGRDKALAMSRSDEPVTTLLTQAFAMGVAEARADECAQQSRHLRLMAYMMAQQEISRREQEQFEHEISDVEHPRG